MLSKHSTGQHQKLLIQLLMEDYAKQYLQCSPQTVESCYFDEICGSFILRQSERIYWGKRWGDDEGIHPPMKLVDEYERTNEMFRQKVIPVIFMTPRTLRLRSELQKLMPLSTIIMAYQIQQQGDSQSIDLCRADFDSIEEPSGRCMLPVDRAKQAFPPVSSKGMSRSYEAALTKDELSELLEISLELAQLKPTKQNR
jgi:hypothetical protein